MALAPVSVGVIGCGRLAQAVHLNNLLRMHSVRVTALADPDPRRIREVKRMAPGATTYSDYQKLLEKADVQAVLVCTPSGIHAEVGRAALEAGKHLYLEKPLATTLADADQIIASWRKRVSKAMIGFNYRFNPLHVEAREFLRKGRLGAVICVRTIFSAGGNELPQWKRKRRTGGGVLLELGMHHFDLVPFVIGSPICEVHAKLDSMRAQHDLACLTMRLRNDIPVQSVFLSGSRQEDCIEVYGEKGRLVVDRFRSLRAEVSGETRAQPRLERLFHLLRSVARSPLLGDDLLAPTREQSYEKALEHFVQCVLEDRHPTPSLWDGLRSLRVAVAAEESARTGKDIPVLATADEDSAY